MAVRQFLGRADRLHGGARAELGVSLAAQVGGLVAPPPPPGTHPERFLAAVMAERRQRDLARMTRERQVRDARQHALHALPFGLDTHPGDRRRP
jgi:type IV secretory pathway TrbL component